MKGTPEERFWPKVDQSNICWEWIGAKDSSGYGSFWDGKRLIGAHVYSYILNKEIKPVQKILHTCDNPGCVNPNHLYQGDDAQNTKDKIERKRCASGEKHPLSKLTNEQIKEAKKIYTPNSRKYGCSALARKFGVCHATMWYALNGEQWKHLNKLRIIGDCHGKYRQYAKIVQKANDEGYATLQIGDFGFSYESLKHFNIDSNINKLIGGNHDNYDLIFKSLHSLDDFGMAILGGVDFYYVRGAFSVDNWWRTPMVNIWPNEELTKKQFETAQRDYENAKPDLMITHDCPNVVRDKILSEGGGIGYDKIETRTGHGLQNMLDSHKPAAWIFGHWHMDLKFEIDGVEFIGLKELGYIDIG